LPFFFPAVGASAYDFFFFKIATTSKVGKPPEVRGATHGSPKERPTREGVERTLKQGQVRKSERSDHFTATILILIVGVKKK